MCECVQFVGVLGGMVMAGVWCGAGGMCEVVLGYGFVSENLNPILATLVARSGFDHRKYFIP